MALPGWTGAPLWPKRVRASAVSQDVEAAAEFGGAGGRRYGDGYFAEPTVLASTGPLRDTATIAFVILPVVMSGYRSGPRWLMALADRNAAETLGAFDAGIG